MAHRLFRVVAPRDDQLLRGHRLKVKLRLARDVRLRSAKLNNVPVKRLFKPRRGGRVRVALLDKRKLGRALPRGRNFIRFVVSRGAKGRKSYETDELAGFKAAMTALVKSTSASSGACPYAYDTDRLVLLALREGTIGDSADFNAAMEPFSTAECKPSAGNWPSGGPFSVIAVPGMLAGRAWVNDGHTVPAPDGGSGEPGALNGFLKQTSDDPTRVATTRAYESFDTLAFDTRSNEATVQIGKASAALPAAALGVFSFDGFDPEAGITSALVLGNTGGDPGNGLEWEKLKAALEGVGAGDGVMIVSTGSRLSGYASEPQGEAVLGVAQQLERLGVNPDVFLRTVKQNGRYSMIATVDTYGRAVGLEASSAFAEGLTAPDDEALPVAGGGLTGTLVRGADSVLIPTQGDPSGLGQEAGLRGFLFQEEIPWRLTPAPGSTGATCQEVAFAYVAANAFGELIPGGPPALWEGARGRACQGVGHTGTAGPLRADNLDGNACAADDPVAIGARGANVRSVSIGLRASYASLIPTFSESSVRNVVRPSGAPFSAADLTCAKNQLIDELAARTQAMRFMDILQKPQDNLEGETVVDLGAIAERVKTGALAGIAGELRDQAGSTTSYWVSFAFKALAGAGRFASFFVPPQSSVFQAARLVSAMGEAGSAIFGIVGGPSGNPVELTNDYVLLASQLDQQSEEVEVHAEKLLTAQRNGVLESEEIALSDAGRLADIGAFAKGTAQLTPNGLTRAQAAYGHRVVQLAYESFLPQLFEGVRLSYRNTTEQTGYGEEAQLGEEEPLYEAIWQDGAWRVRVDGVNVHALTQANQVICETQSNNERKVPFGSADPGPAAGRGESNEYQPLASVAASGEPQGYLDYLLLRSSTVGGGSPSPFAAAQLAPLFAQPGGSSELAGGFYPPDFWYRNLRLARRVNCAFPQHDPSVESSTAGGPYASIGDGDVWPTPTNKVEQ